GRGRLRRGRRPASPGRPRALPARALTAFGLPPAATIVAVRMGKRLIWRRSATAVGIYAAALLGFLGQLLAARALGPREFGLLALVFASTGFFQSFLDLTVEEALIKYGFRYSTAQQWGKLRRLLGR